jgi:hypothetical protein
MPYRKKNLPMRNIRVFVNKVPKVQVPENTITFIKKVLTIPLQRCNRFSVLKQNLIPEQDGPVFMRPSHLMLCGLSGMAAKVWFDGKWSTAKAVHTLGMCLMMVLHLPIKGIA